jgi:membrane protease YdiL (CAAX protease family)
VHAEERQRRRFTEVLAHGLSDPRLRALMSVRADFSGALQNDQPLFAAYHRIDVTPLREPQLREVVTQPANLLGARFESAAPDEHVVERRWVTETRDGTRTLPLLIARRAAEEKYAGALALLSYLLEDMWKQMIERGDGVLRLPLAAIELGGVLAKRADDFLASHPNSEGPLRQILTLKLATVREDGEPTGRRALRSDFTDEEWRLVSELTDNPNRLLATAMPETGEAYAEVAHEAIFGHWQKLRDWVAAEREFLAWRRGLDAAYRTWQATPAEKKPDAMLTGLALEQAQSWLEKRKDDLSALHREFIEFSRKRNLLHRARILTFVGAASQLALTAEVFRFMRYHSVPEVITRCSLVAILAVAIYFNSRVAALLGVILAALRTYGNVYSSVSFMLPFGESSVRELLTLLPSSMLSLLVTVGALCGVAGTFTTARLSTQVANFTSREATRRPLFGYWSTLAWALTAYEIGAAVGSTAAIWWFDREEFLNAFKNFSDLYRVSLTFSFEGAPATLADFVAQPIMIAVLILVLWDAQANQVRYLGLVWTQTRQVVTGILGTFVIIGLTDALRFLTGHVGAIPFDTETYAQVTAAGWLPATMWLRIVVAPAGEEIMFRGFLFRGWARSQRSTWLTILGLSLLSSATYVDHYWTVPLQIFAMGLFLGWMRWRCGSTLLTYFLNALFNAESIIETILQMRLLS